MWWRSVHASCMPCRDSVTRCVGQSINNAGLPLRKRPIGHTVTRSSRTTGERVDFDCLRTIAYLYFLDRRTYCKPQEAMTTEAPAVRPNYESVRPNGPAWAFCLLAELAR